MTTLTPGGRIWRGANGFDTGGTPNVPRYGSTAEDAPSIPGGPVSPSEWAEMPDGIKKLAIKTWATNACRAEGVDEKHWVPYLEKVVSFETGASGVSGTGNPNVVNMYDTNAQKNIPSIGLAQVIQDNAPGQNLLDPVTNLRASIRYIRSTYGDVTNVPEAQGIQAGYQTGGRIWHGAKGFDEGGSAGVMENPAPAQDEIIKEAMEGINERGGITIDLTGHQPSQGYGYAPSKETELMFEAGKITPEDVDAYIDSHFEELQGEGMHFGAWVSEEDSAVYLDVSKVGGANAETLRAAMKAEQLGIWDFGAPPELGELRIGRIDDAGKYIPLGQASDIHAEHAREVQRSIESRSATSAPEVPREPAPEVAEPGPRIWKDGKSFKVGVDGPGKGGPGAAKAPEKASVPEILGKAGKVLGPTLTAANDALMAYGLVDQAAQQGIAEQIAKGNVVKRGPNVLGIPTGTAFSDPTFKNQQSTAGRSPADLQYWLKHGKWPGMQTGGLIWRGAKGFDDGGSANGTGGGQGTHGHGAHGDRIVPPSRHGGPGWSDQATTPFDMAPYESGDVPTGLKLHSGFCIRHADGSTTRHTLTRTGPQHYEADGSIKLLPGDTIELDGHRV